MKANKSLLRVLSAIIALTLLLSLAACGDKPSSSSSGSIIENSSSLPSSSSASSSSESSSSETSSSDSSSSGSSSGSSSASSIAKETRKPADIQADLLKKMVAHHQNNQDTVGWLYFPGTTINEAAVQTVDNKYYERRNNLAKQDFNGCYYMDYRWTPGSRDQISLNTVIYGHAMSDDPNGVKFGQLHKLQDLQFAKDNQFIYFSTPQSEMIWQVFAVFDTTTSFFYNVPTNTGAEHLNVINGARSRSKYIYDVPVAVTDKILTLSTCTYRYDKGFPNKYRYVVMAKLLEKGATPTPAKVEANPSPAAP